MKFHDLRGTQVLSVSDARKLGTIDDLFIHLSDQRVLALRVKLDGMFAGHKALPLQDVKSIGQDAVTVDDAAKLNDKDTFPALKNAAGQHAINGAHVVAENGTEVGTVADLDADFTTGAINGYVLSSGLINRLQHEEHVVPTSTVKSIGDKTIVVADSVTPA